MGQRGFRAFVRRPLRLGLIAGVVVVSLLPQASSASSPTYVPILMYHYIRVNPNPNDQVGFSLSVTPTMFHAQMAYLAANHFNVIALPRAVAAIRTGGWLPSRPVVLTFDDGYDDFYTTAIPELRRWGFTATDYVITGFVGGSSFMNWTKIHEADAMGFNIGAHTVHHVALASISAASAVWEMSQSKTMLQTVLGHSVSDFAYPYGSFNSYLAGQARQLGFESATTTMPGSWHYPGDLWTLSRQRVSGWTTLSDYASLVGGPAPAPGTEPSPPPEPAPVPGPGGAYHPLVPARILDTRIGLGAPRGPLTANQSLDLSVAGNGGVPATGATAVALNVTVTNTTGAGYLTVYPGASTRPTASNLNWVPGQTIANLVDVKLGAGGDVDIFLSVAKADVVVDVQGWTSAPSTPPGPDGLLNPLQPTRILDTRDGTGGISGAVGSLQTITLQVAGAGGVPATGAEAVVLNLTATQPTAPSYVTLWPEGAPQPDSSNLNVSPGQTIPNRVIVKLGPTGKINLYNRWGTIQLIVDINGWFTDGAAATTGTGFVSVNPYRILDTRFDIGGYGWPLFDGNTLALQVAGHGGIPMMNAATRPKAVVLNVTVTDTTLSAFMTAWPDGAPRPLASDLNWATGVTVPNLVVVAVGPNGQVDLFNQRGLTDVVVDVAGYYT